MSQTENGAGGTFEIDVDGERKLLVAPTQPHRDGDRARDADGKPTDAPVTTTEAALPAPAGKIEEA